MSVCHLLFLCGSCIAQWDEAETESRFSVAVKGGVQLVSLIDRTFSNVQSCGYTPLLQADLSYSTGRVQHVLSLGYSSGMLEYNEIEPLDQRLRALGATYRFMWSPVDEGSRRFQWGLGPGLRVLYQQRDYQDLINQTGTEEFIASLAVYGSVSYRSSVHGNPLLISNTSGLSVLSLVSQPVFGADVRVVPADEGGSRGSLLKSLEFAGPGDALHWSSEFRAGLLFAGRHETGSVYTVGMFDLSMQRSVRQWSHFISIFYAYHF